MDDLVAAARRTLGRDASKVRGMVALADGRSESVLESLGRVAIVLAGFQPQVQVWIGRLRCNALTVRGYRVLRFSWEDVVGDPAYVVAKVREALALAA